MEQLAARRRAGVEHPVAALQPLAHEVANELCADVLHGDQAIPEARQAGRRLRLAQQDGLRQPGIVKGDAGVVQQGTIGRRLDFAAVDAQPHRRPLVVGPQHCRRSVSVLGFDLALQPRRVLAGVANGVGGQLAQHGVDQCRRPRLAQRPDRGNGFIDGRMARHAHPLELVNAH